MSVIVKARRMNPHTFGYCFLATYENRFQKKLDRVTVLSEDCLTELLETSKTLLVFPQMLPEIFDSGKLHHRHWQDHNERLAHLIDDVHSLRTPFVNVLNQYNISGIGYESSLS